MSDQVYIRMKKNMEASNHQQIQLKDISFISTNTSLKKELENIKIYQVTKKDAQVIVIDSFLIVDHLNEKYPEVTFTLLGPTETIIQVKESEKKPSLVIVSFVWVLLFIGSAMTIMNFHYDVSMQEVQQKLHFIITGKESEFPLWIQIPYSIGLGVGMLLFLNHWFKNKFNEEPSPLEIELFNYQQNIDQYISHSENKLNDK